MLKTSEDYWDCECEHNYIHPKTQDRCFVCGAFAEEQPDSRVNEIIEYGVKL